MRRHDKQQFSTKDRDHDLRARESCAARFHGGWWYYECYTANLNGEYYDHGGPITDYRGISWDGFHGDAYSLKTTEMKLA